MILAYYKLYSGKPIIISRNNLSRLDTAILPGCEIWEVCATYSGASCRSLKNRYMYVVLLYIIINTLILHIVSASPHPLFLCSFASLYHWHSIKYDYVYLEKTKGEFRFVYFTVEKSCNVTLSPDGATIINKVKRCRAYIFSVVKNACAITVKSSMSSETTKHFRYKCHELFVNFPVMITVKSFLKCSMQ